MTHNLEPDPDISTEKIGANIYYAENDGTIEIGDEGTTTKSWVLAAKPDLISAKPGFIGTFEMRELKYRVKPLNEYVEEEF